MPATATSIPAPVGGLNDRDSLADMPPKDAVVLENFWPYPSFVAVRNGSAEHMTGFSDPVETLVEYLPTTGESTLFAASGEDIYDATTAGAVGSPVQTGLSNARFQCANITTPGGSYLYMVNGEDEPRLWDGTNWVSVDSGSSPAITGVTTTDLVHVTVFKSRLYFVQIESMKLWYLPVNSVGGAASSIDLGSIFRMGGYIMAAYPWTIDAGLGADDHMVVITSNGEVAVYRGTDPSSSATWYLIGVFVLGKPIGRRCATKMGGDLAIMCQEGLYPLGKGLLSSSVDRRVALSDKIQNSISEAAMAYSQNFGWDVCLYPDANMLLVNIPAGNGNNYQFAQNTITGAWAQFTGWNASSWLYASTGLYYGGDTAVYLAWTGNVDVSDPIQADVLPAFNYFGNKAFNKFFTMVRPYLRTTGTPSVLFALNTDFVPTDASGALSYTPPEGMVWGSMVWGTPSMTWGGSLTPVNAWQTVGAVANSASIRLKVQNNGAVLQFTNVDYLFQKSNSVL